MNFEFMTIDTPLPPCMPFPRALTGFPVSSTAKVMYCRMLDAMLSKGQEDENGILFVCFPVTAIAAVLSRSPMTVKRSLNELETAGLIMRVRQGVGEPNRIGKNHCTQHRIDYDTLYSHVLRKIRECARAALMDGEAVADRLTNTCEAEKREQREAMERSLTRDEERIEVLDKMVMRLYEERP